SIVARIPRPVADAPILTSNTWPRQYLRDRQAQHFGKFLRGAVLGVDLGAVNGVFLAWNIVRRTDRPLSGRDRLAGLGIAQDVVGREGHDLCSRLLFLGALDRRRRDIGALDAERQL